MKLIKNNKFKINGIEYVVTGVTYKSLLKGIRESYTFKNCDWDKEITEYTMAADLFESKVSFEQYVG